MKNGLSFLEPEEVEDAFVELYSEAPNDNADKASEFSDYVLKNYIDESDSKCLFPPSMWAEPPSEIPRTTNGLESYHKHLNAQFYMAHPPLHHLVSVLKEVQVETYIKMAAKKPKPLRKGEKSKRDFAAKSYQEYQSKTITRLEYVKKMALRYHV